MNLKIEDGRWRSSIIDPPSSNPSIRRVNLLAAGLNVDLLRREWFTVEAINEQFDGIVGLMPVNWGIDVDWRKRGSKQDIHLDRFIDREALYGASRRNLNALCKLAADAAEIEPRVTTTGAVLRTGRRHLLPIGAATASAALAWMSFQNGIATSHW